MKKILFVCAALLAFAYCLSAISIIYSLDEVRKAYSQDESILSKARIVKRDISVSQIIQDFDQYDFLNQEKRYQDAYEMRKKIIQEL